MSNQKSNVPSGFLFQVPALTPSVIDYDHHKPNEPSLLLCCSWLKCLLQYQKKNWSWDPLGLTRITHSSITYEGVTIEESDSHSLRSG